MSQCKQKNPILLDLPMPIKTPRLLIRNCITGDGPNLNKVISESHSELTKWFYWAEKVPSIEDSELFAREAHANWIMRVDVTLLIFNYSDNRLLGNLRLCRINWAIPSFEIGYWISSQEVGKGYASEAVNAITRYAFDILGAHYTLRIRYSRG